MMSTTSKKTIVTLGGLWGLLPGVALAQTYADFVGGIIDFINILIPAMFALVFVVIMWRVIDAWILHAGDPAKRAEGRQMAIIAVIVVVVAVSILGIVQIIRSSFLGV